MDHQWVVSLLVGLAGGALDGIFRQGGITGVRRTVRSDGRSVWELGTIETLLTGAAAGVGIHLLNAVTFDAPVQPGPTFVSFVTGLGGVTYVRGLRERGQLEEVKDKLSEVVGKTGAMMETQAALQKLLDQAREREQHKDE